MFFANKKSNKGVTNTEFNETFCEPKNYMSILMPDANSQENHNIINIDPEPSAYKDKNEFEAGLHRVIDSCPDVIKEIVLLFISPEEQIMALYSTVALTGSLMPFVTINYDNRINYPCIILLVIFPPASGNGGMSLIRILGQKINSVLIQEYSDQMRQYKLDYDLYKKSLKSSTPLRPPLEPKQILFLAPGDTTTARLIKQISDNGPDQFLTIFETEADVFGNSASNSQYGAGLSTIVRLGFQNEPISQMRKTAGELNIADIPKISMILSGTANQVTKIFKNNEDGMYSRFMIIFGNAPAKWKNVKPDPSKQPLNEYFQTQADEYYKMWQFFKAKHIEVKFSDSQWDRINAFGEKHLAVMHNFIDELSGSIAKRHANMLTRIAATLTMTRYYDLKETVSEKTCSEEDFGIALWMAEQSLKWSLDLYKILPGKRSTAINEQKTELFKGLPNEFSYKEAEDRFKLIKKRTLQRRLNEFVDSGLLKRIEFGKYQKTDMAQLALSHLNQSEDGD
ncbi:MAG: hypothetical protein JWR05_375 [Mucilaginibacter sp.]|nr:hypothetical protein [Mucilaginibacter sp.]